ncbi:MAG: peptide-methionine (R)-S-oxide reductase MsrB [Actinomycetota bacterium]
MKKRHFLQAGVAMVGVAWLSQSLSKREEVMATSLNRFEITKAESEWREILTPEQFYVLRQHGTERAHTSPLDHLYTPGTYLCAGCDLPLFSSATKFNSGTGWPSFYAPIKDAVGTTVDRSLLMARVEVHCRRCGGHLGHVFDDGPAPTGKRYCINGVALKFMAA